MKEGGKERRVSIKEGEKEGEYNRARGDECVLWYVEGSIPSEESELFTRTMATTTTIALMTTKHPTWTDQRWVLEGWERVVDDGDYQYTHIHIIIYFKHKGKKGNMLFRNAQWWGGTYRDREIVPGDPFWRRRTFIGAFLGIQQRFPLHVYGLLLPPRGTVTALDSKGALWLLF